VQRGRSSAVPDSFDLEVKEFDLGLDLQGMDRQAADGRRALDVHGQAKGAGRTLGDSSADAGGSRAASRNGVSRLLDRAAATPPAVHGIVSGVTNTAPA